MLKAAQPVAGKMWTKQAASGQPPAPRGVGGGSWLWFWFASCRPARLCSCRFLNPGLQVV